MNENETLNEQPSVTTEPTMDYSFDFSNQVSNVDNAQVEQPAVSTTETLAIQPDVQPVESIVSPQVEVPAQDVPQVQPVVSPQVEVSAQEPQVEELNSTVAPVNSVENSTPQLSDPAPQVMESVQNTHSML